MKKYLKAKIYLTLAVIAMICYACPGNDNSVDTVYDTAECQYLGNIFGTGKAFFILNIHNANNTQVGFYIRGYAKLPSSFSNFDITGSYTLASSGEALTFSAGSSDDGNLYGSYIYDLNNKKYTLITGGSFNIVQSDGKYIVTTNFTGKDDNTGAAVSNLKYSFTGTITFQDKSIFGDIVPSNFTATGTPSYLSDPGPSTWTGQIIPVSELSQYYDITNWGGVAVDVYCDYKDGEIVMDNYSKVAYDNSGQGYDGYFQAVAINNSTKTIYILNGDYTVAYNTTSKILDFSGTYNGLPVLVGVIAKNRASGTFAGAFTDLYANAKLKLTSASQSSSMRSGGLSYSMSLSPEELKDYKIVIESEMMNPTGIRFEKGIIKE